MPKVINRRGILSEEEVVAMINRVRRFRDKAVISVLWLSGSRISEVLVLRNKDFVFESNNLHLKIGTLKRQDDRMVKFERNLFFLVKPNVFFEVLFDYLNTIKDEEKRIFDVDRDTVLLMVRKANPEGCWPHLFRHTRATLLAERGATESQLVAWFGWSDSRASYRYVAKSQKLIQPLASMI